MEPKFNLLRQGTYEDESGHKVDSEYVHCLATYSQSCDGFFSWECSSCHRVYQTRHFSGAGTVFTCEKCGKHNLLVRTDTDDVNGALGLYFEYDKRERELKRLRDVEDQLRGMKYKAANDFIQSLHTPMQTKILKAFDVLLEDVLKDKVLSDEDIYEICKNVWTMKNGWWLDYNALIELSYKPSPNKYSNGTLMPENSTDVVYNPSGDPNSNLVLTRFMVNELCAEWRSFSRGFIAAFEHLKKRAKAVE